MSTDIFGVDGGRERRDYGQCRRSEIQIKRVLDFRRSNYLAVSILRMKLYSDLLSKELIDLVPLLWLSLSAQIS